MTLNDPACDPLVQYMDLPWYKWIFVLSVGTFLSLFLMVFQPFGVTNYERDFTVNLAFVSMMLGAGLAVIVALAVSEFVLRPLILKSASRAQLSAWLAWDYVLIGTVTFLYYNHLGDWHDFHLSSYGGFLVDVSMVITFPVLGFIFYLRHEALASRLVELSERPPRTSSTDLVHFVADNDKDMLTVAAGQLLYVESQDNYVEVVHLQEGVRHGELIRSTLKRIEAMTVPGLVRCHRSFIVNLDRVSACQGNRNGLKLTLKGVDRPIPVSRAHAPRVMDRLGITAQQAD